MNQWERIVKYLKEHPEGLTARESSLILWITKLSTRICELDPETQKHISRIWETGTNEAGETSRYIRYKWVA